jgi:hypothetical protein
VKSAIPGDENVDFVFDERPELKECIRQYGNLQKESWRDRMERTGNCMPGNDERDIPLQMADLLIGEISNVFETNKPSEVLECINNAHQIIYDPPTPPKWFGEMHALHGFAQRTKDGDDVLQKKMHKEQEQSENLMADIKEAYAKRAEFDARFKLLSELSGQKDQYAEYIEERAKIWEKQRKRRQQSE